MISNLLKGEYLKRLKVALNSKKHSVAPIIILQPGKVGSLSVQYSLEEAYKRLDLFVTIHHAHALNYLDEREEYVKRTRKNPADSLRLIQEWRKLRKDIADHPEKKWNIINLVRDPVAIKVSALFQLLDQHVPDWQTRLKAGRLAMTELDELFFSKKEFGFAGLEQWYDKQIKGLWGLDIFATPFPQKKGYQIYEAANVRLLIIRLEDLDRVAEQAFDDFLGLKRFQVVKANVGDEKPYAILYNEFKKRPLPVEYIEQGYRTRFANHFYTLEELETFRRRWTGN